MHPLLTYLKSGYTDKRTRLFSFLSPFKVAEAVFAQIDWKSIARSDETFDTTNQFKIQASEKRDAISHPVFRYLEANPHPAIRAILLFGSLADKTACAYSDFDGILIIDCSRLKSEAGLLRLRNIIVRSENLMLETDPLQHHGWHFILTDEDRHIVAMDLPALILEESKSINLLHTLDLRTCNTIQTADPIESYRHTVASIRKKLMDKRTCNCLYTFKSLCSEFMLMPALLLQAMNSSVSKKDSFKAIEKLMKTDELSALRTASDWRRNWKKPILNNSIRRFHDFKRKGIRLSFLLPKIPAEILNSYPDWRIRAEAFLTACDKMLVQKRDQT